MADPRGFLNIEPQKPTPRPIHQRIKDYKELYQPMPEESVRGRRRAVWIAASRSATWAARSGT